MTTLAFHVDQCLYPVPGGIGSYVRRLVPALVEQDPSMQVALFHARIPEARPERWMRDYWIEELPGSIRQLYPRWALLQRPALPASLGGLDLLHAPSPSAVPPPGPRQRLVVTVHDVAFLTEPETFPRQWRLMFRAGLRRAVRTADAVIAVSRHTAEDLVRRTRIDPSRVRVVPLGPSLDHTDADVDDVLHRLKVRAPYVLFAGTLEPRKNLTRLVRAYRRLVASGAPHALVLAGPMGWHPQSLMRELEIDGPGEVVLTGHVPAPDLDALYRGAAAFAYPSLYEGFGLPVLDAMARGIPCVVSTSSSLPEVAGEAAVPVDPRSTGALADALERVTTDAALAARLREAGLARAAGYSWTETARRTLEVYKQVS
ncbi:MAG TPA: glycosyltransferase family 1 protein [Actinomycetota bacterium]